jgi:hypothetical protein
MLPFAVKSFQGPADSLSFEFVLDAIEPAHKDAAIAISLDNEPQQSHGEPNNPRPRIEL